MFCIGGVSALKKHAFFEDIDWTDLINLELEPPIDLNKPYVDHNGANFNKKEVSSPQPAPSVSPPPPHVKGKDKEKEKEREKIAAPDTTDADTVEGEGTNRRESNRSDVFLLRTCVESIGPESQQFHQQQHQQQQQLLSLTVEHLTRHFHEGFTGQQVSLSDVDILSNSTRSRAGAYTHTISLRLSHPIIPTLRVTPLSLFLLSHRISSCLCLPFHLVSRMPVLSMPLLLHILPLFLSLSGSESSRGSEGNGRYDGFEFVGGGFHCSVDQVREGRKG